ENTDEFLSASSLELYPEPAFLFVHPFNGISSAAVLSMSERSYIWRENKNGKLPLTKSFGWVHAEFPNVADVIRTVRGVFPTNVNKDTPWPTPATTRGRYRLGSATRTSSIRFDIPSFLPNGSGISGKTRTRHSLAAVTLSMERHGVGNNG